MRETKTWILIVMIFLSHGCATTANYEKKLDSWKGSHINKLIDSWGYPDNSFKAPNGNTVYVYRTSRTLGYQIPNTAIIAPINKSCTTWIESNDEQIIVDWRTKGNECVAK